jgi:hypothetical protein
MSDRKRGRPQSRQEKVAAYKSVIRECLDRRPSGVRQRIALALGTHRSFVSQITNPQDPTAIPARHVPIILEFVHATAAERARFSDAYEAAHPRALARTEEETGAALRTVSIEIPVLPDPAAQAALEELIRTTVQRLVAIARMQTPRAPEDTRDEDREETQ